MGFFVFYCIWTEHRPWALIYLKLYLISSCVWRVLDLCCDYSCRKRTLRQAAFALQKPGEGALLRVPDCIIAYKKKKKRALLVTGNVIPFMVTQTLVLTRATHLYRLTTISDPPVKLLSQMGCRAALKAFSDVRLWTPSRESAGSDPDGRRPAHRQKHAFAAEARLIVLRADKRSHLSTA